MNKVFKGVKCPYGGQYDVDSMACRICCYYVRNVVTFIWCSHPDAEKPEEKKQALKKSKPIAKASKRAVGRLKKKR